MYGDDGGGGVGGAVGISSRTSADPLENHSAVPLTLQALEHLLNKSLEHMYHVHTKKMEDSSKVGHTEQFALLLLCGYHRKHSCWTTYRTGATATATATSAGWQHRNMKGIEGSRDRREVWMYLVGRVS